MKKISLLNIGRKASEETKRKMSKSRSGRNNHQWKDDDNVCKTQIHKRIRKRLPKPQLCPLCLLKPPQQLSNKIHMYNMNLANWWWLCTRCHNRYDKMIDMSDRVCSICVSHKTYMRKDRDRPDWRRIDGRIVCKNCYDKHSRPVRTRSSKTNK